MRSWNTILLNMISLLTILSAFCILTEDSARADWLHPDYLEPHHGSSAVTSGDAAEENGSTAQAGDMVTSGFAPDIDGFCFPNYGREYGDGLTPGEMKRMFGSRVCASTAGGECILTPPAKRWMDEINENMAGGHCEGMAVLSALMYYGKVSPSEFGADETCKLSIEDQPLQHEIAYWFATQYTHPGGDKEVKESPGQVLTTLLQSLSDGKSASEWWELGVYAADGSGGHAVTPFGVQDMGDGKWKIFVYDSEEPGQTQEIDVDRSEDTWSYGDNYSGDATTRNLEITGISPRLTQQQCDFCDDSEAATAQNTMDKGSLAPVRGEENDSGPAEEQVAPPAPKRVSIWLDGNASLLITDDLGRRIGRVEAGKYINEIPGAEIKPLKLAGSNISETRREPMYRLPAGLNFTIKVDGIWLKSADVEDVTVIGPGYDLAVEGIGLDPGEQDYIDVASSGRDRYLLTYRTNYTDSPDIVIGKETDQADFEFTVRGGKIEPEGSFSIELDMLKGRLSLNPIGNSEADMFDLLVSRIDDGGERLLRADNIALKSNYTAYLNFTELKGTEKSLNLRIDHPAVRQ